MSDDISPDIIHDDGVVLGDRARGDIVRDDVHGAESVGESRGGGESDPPGASAGDVADDRMEAAREDPSADAVPEAVPAELKPFRERVAEDRALVVAFRIGGEMHACDIHLVEEVVTKRPIHRLPDMPPRLLGMLRLRGELVPVLDVAPSLDLALESASPAVMVVVIGDMRIGVAADAVREVVTLDPEGFRPAPHPGAEKEQFVVGVARVGGRLVNLIDLAEMLRSQTTLSPEDQSR